MVPEITVVLACECQAKDKEPSWKGSEDIVAIYGPKFEIPSIAV